VGGTYPQAVGVSVTVGVVVTVSVPVDVVDGVSVIVEVKVAVAVKVQVEVGNAVIVEVAEVVRVAVEVGNNVLVEVADAVLVAVDVEVVVKTAVRVELGVAVTVAVAVAIDWDETGETVYFLLQAGNQAKPVKMKTQPNRATFFTRPSKLTTSEFTTSRPKHRRRSFGKPRIDETGRLNHPVQTPGSKSRRFCVLSFRLLEIFFECRIQSPKPVTSFGVCRVTSFIRVFHSSTLDHCLGGFPHIAINTAPRHGKNGRTESRAFPSLHRLYGRPKHIGHHLEPEGTLGAAPCRHHPADRSLAFPKNAKRIQQTVCNALKDRPGEMSPSVAC
jgi:hypothetical protein